MNMRFAILWVIFFTASAYASQVVEITRKISVYRFENGQTVTVGNLKPGQTFPLAPNGVKGGWVGIISAKGTTGWVPEYAAKISRENSRSVKIAHPFTVEANVAWSDGDVGLGFGGALLYAFPLHLLSPADRLEGGAELLFFPAAGGAAITATVFEGFLMSRYLIPLTRAIGPEVFPEAGLGMAFTSISSSTETIGATAVNISGSSSSNFVIAIGGGATIPMSPDWNVTLKGRFLLSSGTAFNVLGGIETRF